MRAIVTGASRGIGAATARRLAADGARVVVAARSAGDLDAVVAAIRADGGEATAVVTDATDLAQLDALVEVTLATYGGIDVLVNNAGVLPPAVRSERLPVEEWEAALRINLTAPWYLATRCHAAMKAAGGGVVVNITSSAALYPSVGLSAYNGSKAAMTMVSKTLALEWARDGIRVVALAPGKVDTALVAPVLEFVQRAGQRVNPLGRVGEPEEVAALVAFVVSDEAAYLTGNVITLDGGEVAATGADAAR